MRIGGLKHRIGGNSKVGCVLDIDFKKIGQGHGQSFMSHDVYGHSCAITGAVWNLNGRSFDNVDDIITIPDAASLRLAAPFTIIANIYNNELYDSTATKRRYIVAKLGLAGATKGFALNFELDGRLRFITGTANTWQIDYSAKASWDIGWWHLAVELLPSSTDLFYVNGRLDKVNTQVHSPIAHDTANLEIGDTIQDAANSLSFNGIIGSLQICNFSDYAARILSRSIEARRN